MTNSGDAAASDIYLDIKRKILSGQYKAGDRLVETRLAREYGASRLHIKSALRLLLAEQLAEYQKMKGFRVVGVSDENLREIADIREALEQVVVRRVIERATAEDIEECRKILRRIKVFAENDMTDDCLTELNNIYAKLYKIAGYSRIEYILNQYKDYIIIIEKRTAPNQSDHIKGYQDIAGLVDSIESKNIEQALAFIRDRHLTLFQ